MSLNIIFLEENFDSYLNNLKLINLFYIQILFYFTNFLQMILFLVYFGIQRHKVDNKIPINIEIASKYNKENKLNLLPIFIVMIFTFTKISVFVCRQNFSNILTDIFIFIFIMTIIFIHTTWVWFKYKSKAEEKFSFELLLVSVLYIIFICKWQSLSPYVYEIIQLANCISSEIAAG